MLKGCQRQIIKISGCADTVFEEAYFILKPSKYNGMSESELIKEANRIIRENSYSNEKNNRKFIRISTSVFYSLLILCFSGFALSLISLFVF